jgi:fatty acid-binding protein DegV
LGYFYKILPKQSPTGRKFAQPGTDVMILKIFSPKKSAKKLASLTQNKAKLFKNLIVTLVFEKNANFFAENC